MAERHTTEDACKLCKQTGGRKDILRQGCSLCGYEGCVIYKPKTEPVGEMHVTIRCVARTGKVSAGLNKVAQQDLKCTRCGKTMMVKYTEEGGRYLYSLHAVIDHGLLE